MQRLLLLIVALIIAIPCSAYACGQNPATAGSTVRQRVVTLTTAPVVKAAKAQGKEVQLTQNEIAALENNQQLSPNLQQLKGAGCKTVWNNQKQQNETICGDPVRYGILVGAVGALFGSLGGVPGAIAGGVIGFGVGYALSP